MSTKKTSTKKSTAKSAEAEGMTETETNLAMASNTISAIAEDFISHNSKSIRSYAGKNPGKVIVVCHRTADAAEYFLDSPPALHGFLIATHDSCPDAIVAALTPDELMAFSRASRFSPTAKIALVLSCAPQSSCSNLLIIMLGSVALSANLNEWTRRHETDHAEAGRSEPTSRERASDPNIN